MIAPSSRARAAVVLLHASLEDLLRSIAEWKLPTASPEALESVPLHGVSDPRRTRFSLAELAKHRGRTVDEVVRDSVVDHLERSSYNDPGDVKRLLVRCGGDPDVVPTLGRWLGPMMKRRHLIVHRADRRGELGHPIRLLRRKTVASWIDRVELLGDAILDPFR